MSDNEDQDDLEITVEVEDQSEEQPEEAKIVKPEDGIADLQRQLDAERSRREAAERMAHDAEDRERSARIDKDESEIHLVTNAIQTLNRDKEILKANYAQALRTGDFNKAAEINDEINEAATQLQQLTNGLEAMKSKPKVQPMPPQSSDPVEAFAARLTPRSADWVRAHPEFVKDSRLNRKMIAAHELAVADGHAPDTDGYFSAIEQTLNVGRKVAASSVNEEASSFAAKAVSRRDAAPAAAPVSRGGSNRTNVVRLSAAEREMADMMNMKHDDYAKNKIALQKEGKLQ